MSTSAIGLSRQLLVGEALKRSAHRSPGKEAFVVEAKAITYKELDEKATNIAGWLQHQQISFNDKVALLMKNSMSFVEIFFGISLSGAVGVPINFRLTANEIEYVLNNSHSKILFIDPDYVATIQSIRHRIPTVEKIIVIGNSDADLKNYSSIFENKYSYTPLSNLSDNDPFMIVYTSGTTGLPKGAVLTHKNLWQNGMNMIFEYQLKRNFRHLIVPPLFHVGSMSFLVNTCIITGTSIIHRDFHPETILKTIEEEKINSLFLVPSMWNFLLQNPKKDKYDLSSMEKCMTAASICPVELKKKIMKYFPNSGIYDVFGQTEMSPCTTCLYPSDSLRKTTSVGKPVVNVEIRVVDEHMNDVKIGEVGENVYRGPTLMKEYYNNEDATKEAFIGGWFHSGDLVRLDEEGFVYVADRRNDLIISGGENIYPAEIEEVLYTHPDILEAAVIGVPDHDWGERVKAFIVLKPGKTLSINDVIHYCSQFLASYKKPKEVAFINELPKNATGKILKRSLREQIKQ